MYGGKGDFSLCDSGGLGKNQVRKTSEMTEMNILKL